MSDASSPMPEHRPITGIYWMVLAGIVFVGMTASVKHLGRDLPSLEIAFLRFALGLLFFIPALPQLIKLDFTPRLVRLSLLRGVVNAAAVTCWFYAMTRIPLSEVTAMNYLGPVYITIGAAFMFGEKLAIRRILAIVVAICGMVIILRPGFRELSFGHVTMLGSTFFMALSFLVAKRLTEFVSPVAVVALMSLGVTVFLAPLVVFVWVTPTLEQMGWLFLVAAFATAGHYTMTLAFRAAPMALTQPITYLQLLWATILGWYAFGEAVDIWVIVGGAVIMAAVSFIIWREAVTKSRPITPPSNATKL